MTPTDFLSTCWTPASPRQRDAMTAVGLGWTNIHPKAFTPTGREICGTKPGATDDAWGVGRNYIPRYTDPASGASEEIRLIAGKWNQGHTREDSDEFDSPWFHFMGCWRLVCPWGYFISDNVAHDLCAAFVFAQLAVGAVTEEQLREVLA